MNTKQAAIYNLIGRTVPGTSVTVIRVLPRDVGCHLECEALCGKCNKLFATRAQRVTAGNVKQCRRCALLELSKRGAAVSRGNVGAKNHRWKGGRSKGKKGYVWVTVPGQGRKLEHRVVMERVLGRKLRKNEEVHHKNGKRHDNREENLELWIKRQPKGQRTDDLKAEWLELTAILFPEVLSVVRERFPGIV